MSKPAVRTSVVILAVVAVLASAISFWYRESLTPKRRVVAQEDIYFWANKSDAPLNTGLWHVYAHYRSATDRSNQLWWSSNNREGLFVYADMETKKLYGSASNPGENAYEYHLLGTFSMQDGDLKIELPPEAHFEYVPSRQFASAGVVYLLTSNTTQSEFMSPMTKQK